MSRGDVRVGRLQPGTVDYVLEQWEELQVPEGRSQRPSRKSSAVGSEVPASLVAKLTEEVVRRVVAVSSPPDEGQQTHHQSIREPAVRAEVEAAWAATREEETLKLQAILAGATFLGLRNVRKTARAAVRSQVVPMGLERALHDGSSSCALSERRRVLQEFRELLSVQAQTAGCAVGRLTGAQVVDAFEAAIMSLRPRGAK